MSSELAAEDPADKPVCKPRELPEPSIPKSYKECSKARTDLLPLDYQNWLL